MLDRSDPVDSERTRAAWLQYVEGGTLDRRVVRPHVARAWERSTRGGCDPRRMRADALDASSTHALLAAQDTLIRTSRPFAAALSRAAGRERHAVMLGDARGRVLDVVGHPESVKGPEAVPGPGSLLDEASAGANGLGTPLAEGTYVELIGPEHFIEGFQIFTCQGIPLLDAEGGQSGVLGISVRRLGAADRVRDILFCAAQAVECEMLWQSLSSAVASATTPGGPDLAERLREDLLRRLKFARQRFEIAADAVSFGGSAVELLAESVSLIRRFRRLADAWRDLVSEGAYASIPIALHDLVADIADLLRSEARIGAIELAWKEDRSFTVVADRQALAQAILGAMLSAMQAAGSGGRVDIALRPAAEGAGAIVRLTSHPADAAAETVTETVAG